MVKTSGTIFNMWGFVKLY